jgi:hypothetical protein
MGVVADLPFPAALLKFAGTTRMTFEPSPDDVLLSGLVSPESGASYSHDA